MILGKFPQYFTRLFGRLTRLAGCISILIQVPHSPGQDKPLWELGLGLGGIQQPCYVGTKQLCSNAFPVVLPIYRGELLKADEKGVRAEFFEDERYKLDVSADFNFAVDSDDIELREGMPDIGNLLQLGPSFEFTAFKDHSNTLQLRFPLRAVIEMEDTDFSSAGVAFAPAIFYRRQFAESSWRFSTSMSVQLRSREFNALYYGVDSRFANPERPSFRAKGGFSGWRLQAGLASNTSSNLWVLFVRYDNISEAAFADSPLVETYDSVSVGLIYSRYLFKSKQRVTVRGDY